MSTTLKTILIVFAVLALIGGGYAVARLIQAQDTQTKEVSFTILVNTPGDFTIDMNPKNPDTGDIEVEVTKGQPAVFTIQVRALEGWDSPVRFTVTGLAEGTYAFSENPVPVDGFTTLTIQTGTMPSNSAVVCTLTAGPA